MKKNVLFLLLLGLLTTVSAQPTHRIKGTVIDKASRQPLEFINVLVLGLGRGGVTDAEGHFNIGEVPPGIYRLQASAVGYKTILTPEYIVSTKDLSIQIETVFGRRSSAYDQVVSISGRGEGNARIRLDNT